MPIRPTVVLYALAVVLAITPRMRADIQRQDFLFQVARDSYMCEKFA